MGPYVATLKMEIVTRTCLLLYLCLERSFISRKWIARNYHFLRKTGFVCFYHFYCFLMEKRKIISDFRDEAFCTDLLFSPERKK